MKRLITAWLILCGSALAQPAITSVYVQSSTGTTATIVWTTSVPATSQIKYGTDATIPYANNVNYTLVTSHSMTLTILTATRPYFFAVVSTASGLTSQSSTYEFALCGSATIPVGGTVNPAYGYGTFTMTWNPPSGSVGTPTVCGLTVATTVTGSLNAFGSLTAVVADSLKVTPGPGSWTVTVTDQGNLSPISVTAPLSAQGQDLSAQLQAAAATAGLVDVIANTITSKCWPSFVCQGTGGGVSGSGTTDYATMWTGATSIGNAQSTDGTANVQYAPGASNLTVVTTLGQGAYFDVENGCGGLGIGYASLDYCTGESGNYGNVAYGPDTMEDTSAGGILSNVAVGNDAFGDVGQNASNNVAIGSDTMEDTSGSTSSNPIINNIALGNNAMQDSGASTAENVALGDNAMEDSSDGPIYDVALGYYALNDNGSGTNNIAIGYSALGDIGGSTSSYNIALGQFAMEDSSSANNNNIAIGQYAIEDASAAQQTVAVGSYAGYGVTANNRSGQDDIYIGYNSAPANDGTDNNEIVIGANTNGNGTNTTTISAGSYPIVLPSSSPTSSAGYLNCAGSSSPYTCVWSTGGGSGAVSSVSNSDGSITFSPTTGAVVGSLNVAHSNTWTANQTSAKWIASTGFDISGATTAGHYLRNNGTDYVDSTIQVSDVPTLNQSTTGNAATATNLASYPALCSGGQFSQGLSSGSNNCATPSGSGGSNVNVNGGSTLTTAAFTNNSGAGEIDFTNPSGSTVNATLHNISTTVNGASCALAGSCNANYASGSFTSGDALTATGTGSQIQDAGFAPAAAVPNCTAQTSSFSAATNHCYYGNSSSAITATLPSVAAGAVIRIQNNNTGTVTASFGSNFNCTLNGTTTSTTTCAIANGTTASVTTDGTSWYVFVAPSSTGGSGTVTSFSAPSGSWPSWLVPTVTNSTTTPSLAVAASSTGSGSVVLATSPTLTTPNLGTPSAINLSNATSLPATALPSGILSCTEVWSGSGTSSALQSGDDSISNNTCYNDSGLTRTITAVKCRNDNSSNTTTVNPTFGSAGTGTTILSSALTCGSSYAYSSSGTVSNASWTTGTGIDPGMGGALTGTSIAVIIEYHY